MILVIPAIEIHNQLCVKDVKPFSIESREYSIDPLEMAIMWRGENAKSLHITDAEGYCEGNYPNNEIIKKIANKLDIPIEVGGNIESLEHIELLFQLNVYRVVLSPIASLDFNFVQHASSRFSSNKIVPYLKSENGLLPNNEEAIPYAKRLHYNGTQRIIYSDFENSIEAPIPRFDFIKKLAIETDLKITIMGGINSYEHLKQIQEFEKYGVDSVIIGRALYENRFPCQALWRINEKYLNDLGPTRRL
ncbi:MAG: HisA/HisF-related TIM barrel protein [Bacteroidetes bacterium]|nr:HisA/HisF-related TIM barrel protein [Bacteroidota bacterium]